MINRTKLTCFFATPIGALDSPERKRADQIQRYILNEALGSKFKVIRADELPHPGSITHQIIDLLYKADLVVADLTGSNANVAYELAIRHSFNKVSIHLADKANRIPFDLKDERTIVFDLNDMDSVAECKDQVVKFTKAIFEGNVEYHSPVFRALGISAATAEEREAFLNKIAEQVDSIATDVSSIDSTLTFSDLDEIDSIKSGVVDIERVQNNIDKSQRQIESDILNIRRDIQRIVDKLS